MTARHIVIIVVLLVTFPIWNSCSPTSVPQLEDSSDISNAPVAVETPALQGAYPGVARPVAEVAPPDTLATSISQDGQVITSKMNIPPGSMLIGVSRLFGTTLGIVAPDYSVAMSSSAPRAIDNIQIPSGARRLAYLALEGINPANNYIETIDLTTSKAHHLKAAAGFAILGFALESGGRGLAFSEVSLRGASSRQASWRLVVADLEGGKWREVMASENTAALVEATPIPFAWSGRTGEVYMYVVRSFSGGWGQGLWAVKPDGSGLRQILPPTSYIGLPKLSPDGSMFAYLAVDMEKLPKKFISGVGEPPGNIVMVKDLASGEERMIAQAIEGAFVGMGWSRDGKEIILGRQAWRENSLQDISVIAIAVNSSGERQLVALPQPSAVSDILEYAPGALFWVKKGQNGAELMLGRGQGVPSRVLRVADGQINMVGILK